MKMGHHSRIVNMFVNCKVNLYIVGINQSHKGAAAYQLGNTSSRTITEVKQR